MIAPLVRYRLRKVNSPSKRYRLVRPESVTWITPYCFKANIANGKRLSYRIGKIHFERAMLCYHFAKLANV